ncbi:MAG: DUF6600 domain-containing protein, partial [Bryobacteraceae bacterium]
MERTLAVLFLIASAVPAIADENDNDPDSASRGVARLSVISGDVSIRRGDSGDHVAAAVNAPLVIQDRVLTGHNSRAEIQFDWANMLRLSSNAEARMGDLQYRRYQVQIARGVTTFRVLRDSEADVEISTPAVSVRPIKKGVYRIWVRDDGVTEITVRSGEVEVFTPRGVEKLGSGKTMIVRGTASDPEFQIARAIPEDEWDEWNRRRDRDLERSASYRYVPRDVYGADDLDGHGRWVYDEPYGYVWTPAVHVGWAPYRHGRWAWIDWYGWSWISYDPWGWAPYHYGRWYSGRHGWCWYPGTLYGRHYWSPALVAFFGWGHRGGVGIGIGFGSVGWVPLAPYERYHRWYGRGIYGGYRNNTVIDNSVRITNVNITNVYRNARVANGVTGIDAGDFTRGRSGNRISGTDFRRASLVQGQVPVTPGRESLRLADREVRTPEARRTDDGRFFSRRPAQTVDRVPFEEQRRGVERASRRAFETPQTQTAEGVGRVDRGDSGDGRGDRAARTDRQDAGSRVDAAGRVERGEVRSEAGQTGRTERGDGFRRLGDTPRSTSVETPRPGVETPRPSEVQRGGERTESSPDRGWRRFGDPGPRDRSNPQRLEDAVGRGDPGGRVNRSETRTEPERGSTRRFGEPARTENQNRETPRGDSESWRRFESQPAAPAPESERRNRDTSQSAPRVERAPQFERPRDSERMRNSSPPEPVRVSPPI